MANPRVPLSRLSRRLRPSSLRPFSSAPTTPRPHHDPFALLSQPTWSVRTLLASSPEPTQQHQQHQREEPKDPVEEAEEEEEITPAQLNHLLRLSALPQPTTPSETASLLATLRAQLRFVRDVRRVRAADGVEPLSAIRDETAAGLREAAVTPETLRDALAREDVFGRCRRPRRRRQAAADAGVEGEKAAGEEWDVLGQASERVGRYFVVRSAGSGKVEGTEQGAAGKEGQ